MGLLGGLLGGLGGILGGAAKLVGGLGGLAVKKVIGGGKKKKAAVVAPGVREFAASAVDAEADELRRRRGAASDMITGRSGAEPGAGSIGRLIVGS